MLTGQVCAKPFVLLRQQFRLGDQNPSAFNVKPCDSLGPGHLFHTNLSLQQFLPKCSKNRTLQ
jgi:hypothetical protein